MNKGGNRFLIIFCILAILMPGYIQAVEVTIDSTIDTAVTSHNGSSPTVVFISDQTGYAFYRDFTNACVYSKTTNGGTSWGVAVTVDAQTDCLKIAVWYDRWTPGDTTGTYIHIVTLDAADLWYTRLDTSGDTLTTTVNASAANQGGGFAVGANIPSITKGTDGDLYMGVQDPGDSFVIKCSTSCQIATNWTEAGTIPFDFATDWLILMPLSSGNILAIRWDISANDVQSKVYNDSGNSWDISWTTIDVNAVENSAYDAHFGATLNKSTGDIYLAYATDVVTFGTNDDIRTAIYSSGVWTLKSDVLRNSAKGITGTKISFDENTNEIYAIYTARTTSGTASTGNVYWKKSADNMVSWGAEQGPINTTAGNIYGARVNIISNERIYATWDLTSADDLFGNTIADLASSDSTAPSAVSNLATSNSTVSSIDISWTAPGDDGSTGTATSYDLRYSTSAITSGNFSSATAVTGEPTPSVAGSSESMTVSSLSEGITYYFAIKTSDEVPNTSAISNISSLATTANVADETTTLTPQHQLSTVIKFYGRAYPGATVTVLAKSGNQEVPLKQQVISADDGSFGIEIEGMFAGYYSYGLKINDKDGRATPAKFYDLDLSLYSVTDKNIFAAPTLSLVKDMISGKSIVLSGYATANNEVRVEIDGKVISYFAIADQSGFYRLSINIQNLSEGTHTARVMQSDNRLGQISDWSLLSSFMVPIFKKIETDFNVDGIIDIRDWSIFLSYWGKSGEERKKIDLNGDGMVDISDFSLFITMFKK